MRIFEDLPQINFMRYKSVALAASWGIIIFCFLWMQPWKGINSRIKLGIQFTGGIDMMIAIKGSVHQDDIRTALYNGGIYNAVVVAYKDTPGTSVFSIKMKAKKGQDEKDSGIQVNKIINILKDTDAKTIGDNRPDINTESAIVILNSLIQTNPLKLTGHEHSVHLAYEQWVNKIVNAREHCNLLSSFDQLPKDIPLQIRNDLEKNYRLGIISILKNESFSPSISNEWTWKTLQAVFWAMGAILVYILLRFTISFAIGGLIALIHDVLMALGLFVLFGFEFSVPVVASFLILLGYSMTDTIVVFDRIRENRYKPEYRNTNIISLVNDSINQTLSRTILSSLSVLFIALCLFIWGGHAMRDLSFPILIGVITGTYSSIFIASSMVVYWELIFNKNKKIPLKKYK
jgi:preprotein translocase subunit SecF